MTCKLGAGPPDRQIPAQRRTANSKNLQQASKQHKARFLIGPLSHSAKSIYPHWRERFSFFFFRNFFFPQLLLLLRFSPCEVHWPAGHMTRLIRYGLYGKRAMLAKSQIHSEHEGDYRILNRSPMNDERNTTTLLIGGCFLLIHYGTCNFLPLSF